MVIPDPVCALAEEWPGPFGGAPPAGGAQRWGSRGAGRETGKGDGGGAPLDRDSWQCGRAAGAAACAAGARVGRDAAVGVGIGAAACAFFSGARSFTCESAAGAVASAYAD